jgi:hypothetical protein
MRNAWWHTQTQPGGHDSISELVAFALLPVVEELEARYNAGSPFPEIPERRRPKAGPSGRARQAHALRVRAAVRREDGHTGPAVGDDDELEEGAHERAEMPPDSKREPRGEHAHEAGPGVAPEIRAESTWT